MKNDLAKESEKFEKNQEPINEIYETNSNVIANEWQVEHRRKSLKILGNVDNGVKKKVKPVIHVPTMQ